MTRAVASVLAAALAFAPAVQAAGPAPAEEPAADDDTPPAPEVLYVTLPAARHEFPADIMERMRDAILIRTGQIPDPAEHGGETQDEPAAGQH